MTPDEIKAATTAPETRNAQLAVDHYETKAEAAAAVAEPTQEQAQAPAQEDGQECDCPLCQLERGGEAPQIVPIPLEVLVNALTDICAQENARWDHDPETGAPLDRNFGEMIALAHGELSEALEGHRKDLVDPHLPEFKNVDVELADAVIRICHLAGLKKINLGAALVAKLRYNRTREDHTAAARTAQNGKRY